MEVHGYLETAKHDEVFEQLVEENRRKYELPQMAAQRAKGE